MSSACDPCPFISGAFGLVPGKDAAFSSFQSNRLLAQKASACELKVCEPEQGDLKSNSVLLELEEDFDYVANASALLPFVEARSGLEGWDPTTRIFTVPVTGNYTISLQAVLPIVPTGRNNLIIRKEPFVDGDTYQWTQSTALQGDSYAFTVNGGSFLQAGDQIGLRIQNTAQNMTVLKVMDNGSAKTQSEIILHEESV